MPNYEEYDIANDTYRCIVKDNFKKLKELIPDIKTEHITSIGPSLTTDDTTGKPTEDAAIYIRLSPKDTAPVKPIPIQAFTASCDPIPDKEVTVHIEGFVKVVFIGEHTDHADLVPKQELFTGRVRPALGGYSIGRCATNSIVGADAGTLGGVVRDENNQKYILSNKHVMVTDPTLTKNDDIYQPSPYDSGSECRDRDVIATLDTWIPIENEKNTVDCAIARVNRPDDASYEVKCIGIPQNVCKAGVGDPVRKTGRTTNLTFGYVISTDYAFLDNCGRWFVNQLKVSTNKIKNRREPMVGYGDSGSLLWLQDELTVVGLLFADEDKGDIAYANKIDLVIDELERKKECRLYLTPPKE